MQLGIIGLGRMGGNMSERLVKGGHDIVGFSIDPKEVENAASVGVKGADSLEDLVQKLSSPRVVWLMVPAGKPVEETLEKLSELLETGDIIIDGGNSNYKDSVRRGFNMAEKGIKFLDVGVSGGIWGLKEGYSMMIGGEKEAVDAARGAFETLAPADDKGWGHVGPSGSGHFVKMLHNGIEYGMMQAYAEGYAVMQKKEEFGIDLHQVTEIWQHGSVVRSWLLDLIASGMEQNQKLEGIAPYVDDSGEGRWTVAEAIELNDAAPVMTMALLQRLKSRDNECYGEKMLAMMRHQFGGHPIKQQS